MTLDNFTESNIHIVASFQITISFLFLTNKAKVTSNRELRVGSTHDNNVGSTRCIEISLEGTGLSYNTADNLAVLPENNPVNVTALCNLLGYSSNQLYTIERTQTSKDVKDDFPSPFTSRDVLTKFLDLEGLPRASTLEQFIPYLQDEKQKDWLRKLVSKDHRSEFKVKVENEGKTTFELLMNELSSIKIPLVDLMHIVPHMQPRYYTISSSSSLYPTSVHITGKSISHNILILCSLQIFFFSIFFFYIFPSFLF